MTYCHLAPTQVTEVSQLIALANWMDTIMLNACHAVLVPSGKPTVITAIPVHAMCPKKPVPICPDYCAPH